MAIREFRRVFDLEVYGPVSLQPLSAQPLSRDGPPCYHGRAVYGILNESLFTTTILILSLIPEDAERRELDRVGWVHPEGSLSLCFHDWPTTVDIDWLADDDFAGRLQRNPTPFVRFRP